MNTHHETALRRVEKARARLIFEKKRTFYRVLVQHVEPVICTTIETAATDGRKHYWNPDFVATLTDDELLGVQAHELEHDARHHGTRRGAREPVEWNVAGDYSINIDLLAEGFTLPKGALVDEKYRGMASEDIYRTRELDRQKEQEQPEPETPEGDEGETEEGLEGADTDPGKSPGDEGDDGDEAGDEDNDHGDCNDDEDGDSGDAGDEGTDADDQGEDGGDGEGGEAGDKPGQGKGTGDAGDAGEGAGEAEGEGEEGDTSGSEPRGHGDPGRCGEVLDTAGDPADLAQKDIDWDKIVRQAAFTAEKAGCCPGHVTREIERANNPTRDWRDELREFCEQGALRIETWNRPNRRFMGRGIVLPGTQRDGVNKAVFIVDTSGSCDDVALACVNNEAQALLDDGVIDQVVVLYGDTRLTREDVYQTGDQIVFDPRGGGGTDMKPLFAHVAEQHDDASLVVCFTDLYIGDAGPEPHCPTLFAVHGYPDQVKQLIANAPWGARGIDVGAH